MSISLTELTDTLAQRQSSPVNDKGCVLWQGGRTRDGYGKLSVPWEVKEGGHMKIHRKEERVSRMMHLIMYNLNRKCDLPPQTWEMSHLCHTRLCVLPDHLILEPKAINQERRHCVQQQLCTKSHNGYPDCFLW